MALCCTEPAITKVRVGDPEQFDTLCVEPVSEKGLKTSAIEGTFLTATASSRPSTGCRVI